MKISQGSRARPTAALVLADGRAVFGTGLGAAGEAVGEICFNTAMTGYQEMLTDPSYAEQIVAFTFPHIGNVGANAEDVENASPASAFAARAAIFRASPPAHSNYRAQTDLNQWLRRRGIVAIADIDTRALTRLIRREGMPHGVVAHDPAGAFDVDRLAAKARSFPGLKDRDLTLEVSAAAPFVFEDSDWAWPKGFATGPRDGPHVVVIDYGVKRNILRRLVAEGCRVSVAPAGGSIDEIIALNPDGVVLANGPGDPAATAASATPVIRSLIDRKIPLFGICLGHQLLALALGGRTVKMDQGHHGANHPVQDLRTGKVEIVSMNHGFVVDADSLPETVEQTHISLFDGSNCGLALKDAPAMSVQHHPEASPGPQDSFYIFRRFVDRVKESAA